MKLITFLYCVFFLISSSFSYAEEISCNDVKNLVIENKGDFIAQPEKDEVYDYGFTLWGEYNEDGNFIYDFDSNESEGIYIKKILNENLNETFKRDDIILKIDNTTIADLFADFSAEEASLEIDNLFEKENLLLKVKNLETEKITSIEIFKQIYDSPLSVWVDLSLDDITFINVKDNTYNAKYNYSAEWKDDRFNNYLKKIKDKQCHFKRVNENDIFYKSLWQPEIIEENKIDNIDTFDSFQYVDIFIYIYDEDETAYVLMTKYNNAVFNTVFNLKEFPFDNQIFGFYFYTPEINSEIIFEKWYDQQNVQAGWDYFLENIVHPEWNFKNIDSGIYQQFYVDDTFYDNYYLEVKAERNISYYFTKVIIPIFIILIICWSVFWVSGIQLESRLTVTSVSFLALIAYNYVVEDDLPKLGYNTILDYVILCSYVFAGMATILTIYSYSNCKKNGYDFCTVDYLARYLGPIVYLITNIFLISYGLHSMTAGQLLGRLL